MRAGLGSPSSPQGIVAGRARCKPFSFLTQALCLFGKTFFQWVRLLGTASVLRHRTLYHP
jgi:hypothetical protein